MLASLNSSLEALWENLLPGETGLLAEFSFMRFRAEIPEGSVLAVG